MNQLVFIGLGNPGPHYANTRHNAGFLVIDEFLKKTKKNWKIRKQIKEKYELYQISFMENEIYLIKPLTYMNLSGEAVKDFRLFNDTPLSKYVIIYDDFSLPIGKIRLRLNGSSGGQKGMESILDYLNSNKIKRIKVGIGPLPENIEVPDFVLSEVAEEDAVKFSWALSKTVEAMNYLIYRKFENAMNKYNGIEYEEKKDL